MSAGEITNSYCLTPWKRKDETDHWNVKKITVSPCQDCNNSSPLYCASCDGDPVFCSVCFSYRHGTQTMPLRIHRLRPLWERQALQGLRCQTHTQEYEAYCCGQLCCQIGR